VLVLFALSAIFLVGIAGTAVDAGMGYRQQQVQANAAAAAARGATVYLSENKATASDAQVKCVVTLYAGTGSRLTVSGRVQPTG
jgi:Flp pilus assembly protein TadG